jgi:hypothetical protein
LEQQFITTPGREVTVTDINKISANAALAGDHLLNALLRVGSDRGIVKIDPYAAAGPLIAITGHADAGVNVSPFLAVVSQAVAGALGVDSLRSALSVLTNLSFAPATLNRWDLIYARIDTVVPDAIVPRYAKTSTSPAVATNISATISTTVIVSGVRGVEATNPTRPALPADSGNSFYILLGYVFLPAGHGLTSTLTVLQIQESAHCLTLSAAAGVASLRPASINSDPLRLSAEPWTVATGRPKSFVPSTMIGGESRLIALHLATAPDTTLAFGVNVLDDSIDWRNRVFRIQFLDNNLSIVDLPWTNAGTQDLSYVVSSNKTLLASSFHSDTAAGFPLLTLTIANAPNMASGSRVRIWVDSATGVLKASYDAPTAGCSIVLWLEASARFENAF